MTRARLRVILLLSVVGLVAVLPRVLDLGAFLSPDEERWRLNTVGFADGLRTGDLRALYQQPHPGITNMWLTWATIDKPTWAERKFPLAVGIAFLIVAATALALRLWGWWMGAAVGFALALHPYFIGHSRILAMDALLSIFLVLALLALLLWLEERQGGGSPTGKPAVTFGIPGEASRGLPVGRNPAPGTRRLLGSIWFPGAGRIALSGVFGGLAILSKLAGAVIVPFVVGVLGWLLLQKSLSLQAAARALAAWLLGAVAAVVIFFPTVAVHPAVVLRGAREFISQEHFQHPAHALGPRWYPEALLIFTTPLQFLALAGLVGLPRASARTRRHLAVLAGFAALFFLAMQFSTKKGDRYLLPDYMLFDVIAVLLLAALLGAAARWPRGVLIRRLVVVLIAAAAAWQIWNVVALHPYALAYRNPFFRSVALHRPMGWGEGLDLAAEYLNAKPGSEQMLVASYYEGPFEYRFHGNVTSVERLARESLEDVNPDYVVLYRTMVGRGPTRWETKVLEQFKGRAPEKVISLNGEEHVWIYRTK